jgi:hypothetical protein
MNRGTTVGDFVSLLRTEIAERQALLAQLESRIDDGAPALKKRSIGIAAASILRDAGRPMHGLDEILPALVASGYEVKRREGFATTLLRVRGIVRVAPGTFAYDPNAPVAS